MTRKSISGVRPGRITWHKFTQNHLAMFGLVLILLAVVVAFLGSLIRPDGTRNANDILLS
ncbi:MAG: hypothetical protein ACFB10_08720, partial [Salibacteraceae bacterium]